MAAIRALGDSRRLLDGRVWSLEHRLGRLGVAGFDCATMRERLYLPESVSPKFKVIHEP